MYHIVHSQIIKFLKIFVIGIGENIYARNKHGDLF